MDSLSRYAVDQIPILTTDIATQCEQIKQCIANIEKLDQDLSYILSLIADLRSDVQDHFREHAAKED